MSDFINTNLLELAADHIDFWAGEGIGAVLEDDLKRNDLDSLAVHVKESAGIMNDLNEDYLKPMTDERAEAMYVEQTDAF